MSYERVSTPCFWLDYIQYLKSQGIFYKTQGYYSYDSDDNPSIPINLYELNPAKTRIYPYKLESAGYSIFQDFGYKLHNDDDYGSDNIFPFSDDRQAIGNFIGTANMAGLLGHNLYSNEPVSGDKWKVALTSLNGFHNEYYYNFIKKANDDIVFGGEWNSLNDDDIYIIPDSDGYILANFSGGLDTDISSLNNKSTNKIRMVIKTIEGSYLNDNTSPKLGSHIFGRKFEMPTAPNMSLTQEYLFDGTKTQKSRGGATLTNTLYDSPPKWGDLSGWERTFTGNEQTPLNYRNIISGRKGRRAWSLKFSFISEENAFPKHILGSDGTDFYSMVGRLNEYNEHSAVDTVYGLLSLTLGGALPFIFQPDKDEDNFAIVRLDQKSLSFRQASHRSYDFSCKLIESW